MLVSAKDQVSVFEKKKDGYKEAKALIKWPATYNLGSENNSDDSEEFDDDSEEFDDDTSVSDSEPAEPSKK